MQLESNEVKGMRTYRQAIKNISRTTRNLCSQQESYCDTKDSSRVISCLTAASMFASGIIPLNASLTRLWIRAQSFCVASGNSLVSRQSRFRT